LIFQNFDFLFRKNSEIFFEIFLRENVLVLKNIFWKKFLPMSTQNFLRIPKIVLRKLCDEPKHAKTSTLVFFVYLKHRKYPPSDHPRTSSDPGYSGGIRSYGALFFTKRSTKPELISKMEFPIDLGFSLVDRYIVTALGKIKKQFLSVLKHF